MSKARTGGLLLVGGGAIALLYLGLRGTKKGVEQLKFAISNFKLGAIHLLYSNLNVDVKVDNPADQSLKIDKVEASLNLYYGTSRLANLNKTFSVTLDPKGSFILPLSVSLQHLGVFTSVLSALKDDRPIDIDVIGTIKYMGITVPVKVKKSLLP